MENNENNSTIEESSKLPYNEPQNIRKERITTRITLQPPNTDSKKHKNLETQYINKNNESLPIKRNISVYNFKLVLIGNVSVGKSSIIKRYISNEFNKSYFCTIGTELFKKELFVGENKKVNLFIWDTCGQERFRTVTRQYYRNTQAILLVFDLTNEKSFTDLDSWFQEASNYINDKNCLFFLLGNKYDETKLIKIDNNIIKEFMRKYPTIIKYFEVSACNGHNINNAFEKISQYLVKQFRGEEINKTMKEYKNNLKLKNEGKVKKRKDVVCC